MTIMILDPRGARDTRAERSTSLGEPVDDVRGKRIGIRIDEMWESWTWVASEWAKKLEELGAEPVVWRAPIAKGENVPKATEGFAAFKQSVDAAIVGICNCGSCSMWAIHDALEILDADIPTVVVATEQFERLARLLAEKGGRDEIRLVTLPFPLEGRPEPEVRAIGIDHFEQMLDEFGAKAPTLLGADAEGWS